MGTPGLPGRKPRPRERAPPVQGPSRKGAGPGFKLLAAHSAGSPATRQLLKGPREGFHDVTHSDPPIQLPLRAQKERWKGQTTLQAVFRFQFHSDHMQKP